MSLREPLSLDLISMTSPTLTAPMPFLASSSGPGHAVPRASITLFAVTAANCSLVIDIHLSL